VKSSGAQGQHIEKPEWFRVHISVIDAIKNTESIYNEKQVIESQQIRTFLITKVIKGKNSQNN